jgi:hypothetical protein
MAVDSNVIAPKIVSPFSVAFAMVLFVATGDSPVHGKP